MTFTADKISYDYNKYGILVISFISDSNYVIIQYNENHGEVEAKLGMDTYHIERDDQSYGGYGGVQNWNLQPNSILFKLDENGKNILKTDQIEITFNLAKNQLLKLREKLTIALGG